MAQRSEAPEPTLAIDDAEIDVIEPDQVRPVAALSYADQFAIEGLTHEHTAAAPFDIARLLHSSGLMVGVIPGILDAIRHLPE